jgi:hypothetical protein
MARPELAIAMWYFSRYTFRICTGDVYPLLSLVLASRLRPHTAHHSVIESRIFLDRFIALRSREQHTDTAGTHLQDRKGRYLRASFFGKMMCLKDLLLYTLLLPVPV